MGASAMSSGAAPCRRWTWLRPAAPSRTCGWRPVPKGWVSIFDPLEVARVLGLPEGAEVIALLCLGPVSAFYEQPMLQQERWARRAALGDLVFDEQWGQPSALFAEGPTRESD